MSQTDAAIAPPAKPRVAIIGGGIAGLTCALKLAQSGCAVTIYEAKGRLGGNLSSDGEVGKPQQDVYPHIFPDWYANFWRLVEQDLGFSRSKIFAPRWGVKVLDKPGPGAPAPRYLAMEYAPTLKAILTTLRSGVLSIPDFVLFSFLSLDLAASPPDPSSSDMLNQLDVNGFFYSRGYSTEAIAALQDYIISVIWSIPSTMTSARTYQEFIKHQLSSLGPKTPYAWMLKGSLREQIIDPLEATLIAPALGCVIYKNAPVDRVEVVDGIPYITLAAPADGPATTQGAIEFDYAVMSVPGPVLGDMVMRGADGHRLVDHAHTLSQLQRTWGEAIPVINLFFKHSLEGIPSEIVGLRGSEYDLTFLDISQLWDDPNVAGGTVLVVAASNAYAIPSSDIRQRGMLMIQRLSEYLPDQFEAGGAWGESADIDWDKTVIRSNDDNLLFVNDVGSNAWRPRSHYDALPNVFFAGDVCQTDVSMATVEAAVQSGLLAAQALQSHEQDSDRSPGRMDPAPILLAPHNVYSDATFLAAKLALLPIAYGASACTSVMAGLKSAKPEGDGSPAYSHARYALLLPFEFAIDWWKTAYWLTRSLRINNPMAGPRQGPIEGVAAVDQPVGLGVDRPWTSSPSASDTPARPGSVGSAFLGLVGKAAQIAADQAQVMAHRRREASRRTGDNSL